MTTETNADLAAFTELDYIADLLYQRHAQHVQGYAAGVRWWCHRPDGNDGQEHWRQVARASYEEWAAGERKTLREQNKRFPV